MNAGPVLRGNEARVVEASSLLLNMGTYELEEQSKIVELTSTLEAIRIEHADPWCRRDALKMFISPLSTKHGALIKAKKETQNHLDMRNSENQAWRSSVDKMGSTLVALGDTVVALGDTVNAQCDQMRSVNATLLRMVEQNSATPERYSHHSIASSSDISVAGLQPNCSRSAAICMVVLVVPLHISNVASFTSSTKVRQVLDCCRRAPDQCIAL